MQAMAEHGGSTLEVSRRRLRPDEIWHGEVGSADDRPHLRIDVFKLRRILELEAEVTQLEHQLAELKERRAAR